MADGIEHRVGLLEHLVALGAEGVGNGHEHALEAGTSPLVVGRKISSAVKRFALRREKGGERPATLTGHGLHRRLVAAVNVGTLVAVHLDGDEVLIHDARHFGIVIRLAVHDVAPVTPHRADVEQHGLVLALGGGKGFLAPLMPADGLVHGGTQIRG